MRSKYDLPAPSLRRLEALDGMVERLAHQQFANDPSPSCHRSDHGFMNIRIT